MDDSTRQDFYERATRALDDLAIDPAGVLRSRSITGEQSNRTSPVVHYLNAEVPPPAGHRWLANKDHVRLQFTAELESILIVFTPDAIRHFEDRFDRGAYPDLLEADRG